MDNTIRARLAEYYLQQGIHPEKFRCKNQSYCRQFAYDGKMTETKMSLVGSRYGNQDPKIVVLSLDPPLGEKGNFIKPNQRTIEYITATTEAENYAVNRPNVHWAMTQIIVKDILCLFGYRSRAGAAVVLESYSGRSIENVSAYFAHINAAKCSMNNPDKGQADPRVHEICNRSYLLRELEILACDILISQGTSANKILGNLLGSSGQEGDLPKAFTAQIGGRQVLWLPMVHPSRHTSEIRQCWPYYVQVIKGWGGKK